MKFYPAGQYQAACNELFVRYERGIKKLIPNAKVEHVGASSIPSAVSKGDLDIFVGVELGEFEDVIERLTTLGFNEKLDTLRTPELCMLESTSSDDVALQVVANGSEFECFLRFRDKLRANPALVQQYNTLKMSCEGWSQEKYRGKKSTFIEHVLAVK
ncbi:GrpB family protein [Vibrio splendidus]|uniref:GrpB family protein n=1 Tax=Vibrio splendidus TaxID=29497 RepID=UPI001C075A87|nr:GrpB family protein [Vibrio splendidus]MBU2909130.1 GrpB family protein [Vibrio splendidus]MDO6529009.1 GrpB family protein [Vibrio splendidus]MDO6550370.1 GrpB family protein [Vibrio splendidus]